MEPSAFAALLRDHRVAAGLSQEALAERAGLSLQAVSALERGQRRGPRHATVAALAAALDLSEAQAAALDVAARRQRRPRPAAMPPLPGGPRPATPILGRETDLAVLPFLLRQADVRLLTLVGPAGVGKTRLALEVASRAASTFPDGITWVDLAPLRDPALVAPTLAARLGLRPDTAADAAGLVARLHGRDALVILDNMEQVLPAATLVQDVLDACPRLHVLATSRVRLGLRDERPYALAPLALPPPGEGDPGRVEEYAAVALFLERARAVSPGLTLTTSTAPMVAAVCRRLDGLPLALELAAALARLLPPRAMLARLSEDRADSPRPGAAHAAPALDLLDSGSWDRSERQQTMRQAIAWSYDLLTTEQQALFQRLAVFVGGCTPEAAQAVDPRNVAPDALAGVDELARHSLVRVEEQADRVTRFVLLETIREFGLEQLEVSGEAEAARRAHAVHYLAIAEIAEPELKGPAQAQWVERLEREHDNLRAALAWAHGRGVSDIGLRLAGALGRFWELHGHLREGRAWLERMLMPIERNVVPTRVWVKALDAAGRLACRQGDLGRAAALLEEGVSWAREAEDARAIALTLNDRAMVAIEQANYGHAEALLKESLRLWQELGDAWGLASALNDRGIVADCLGDGQRAIALLEESVSRAREAGDVSLSALALENLGQAVRGQGDLGRATALLEESLTLRQDMGDTWGQVGALNNLGTLAHERGDDDRALALLTESLALAREVGDQKMIAYGLEDVASVMCGRGQPERAARLCGAAATLRDNIGAPRPPSERASYDDTIVAARIALGDDAFTAAWSAGQALPLARAVGEAMQGATAEDKGSPGQ